MSTIKSSAENLTLNADGANNDIKFQSNGSEVASIDQAGLVTATTFAGSAASLTNVPAANITGTLPAIDGSNLTGISSVGGATGVDFNDNVKARFGTGNDLEIYHNGTQSILYDASDINLETETNILMKRQSSGGATMFKAIVDGAVELYHDNTKKLETTAGGIKVTNAAGTVIDCKTSRTIEQFGTANNWMHMMWAGSNANEYYMSFRLQNNTQVGTITTNGSSTTYTTSSDYRLKENVDYTWDATTRLKQLKPARFNFIADDTNTLVDGFIAHEVSSVVPEAITGEKDAMEAAVLYVEGDELPSGKSVGDVKFPEQIAAQAIDQSKLVPLLVKTIQELEARITALEA